jgi:hypothetical protein
VFNAIWYGGLLVQQLAIDIAMQIREHTIEFYKSGQQQIKFKRNSYKALTDYCNTKTQRQASSRDKIVKFTLTRFPVIEEVQQWDSQIFTVRDKMTPRRNDPRRIDPR